jgi:AcrR family transcriptional regulator
MALESTAGRTSPARSDSLATQRKLIDAVGTFFEHHGHPPRRLTDVAKHAGVSNATAYRHFTSVDQVASAFLARLPEHAVRTFESGKGPSSESPVDRLHHWNRAWVDASLRYGPSSIPLRLYEGFLSRRARNEPTVSYVCAHVEPLLAPFGDVLARLVVWNAVSDPREVVDLRVSQRWSATRITALITKATLTQLS